MAEAGDRRFLVFLTLSIALHALWLVVPVQRRIEAGVTAVAPMDIHLLPAAPQQKSAVAVRRGIPRNALPAAASASAAANEPAAAVEAPAGAHVDLDAAFATARSLAKEMPAAAPSALPRATMAAAVAGALRTNETIETRGANGEYVTIIGKTRCVTPLSVPHFLEGKTMLTLCETRKG